LTDRSVNPIVAIMTRGKDTRTRILRAAVELMGREGPGHFTASALAREVGVSKATLFHHFASLDDIPLAALEEVLMDAMTRLGDDDRPLEEYLEGMGREMEVIAHDERFLNAYFVFFIKGIFDPRLRQRLAEGGFELHRQVMAALGHRLAPEEDAEAVARLVEVILDGIALHHLLMGDHEVLDRAWRRFIRLVGEAQMPAGRPRRTRSERTRGPPKSTRSA
jgi:AcrR family transcriptional regulator